MGIDATFFQSSTCCSQIVYIFWYIILSGDLDNDHDWFIAIEQHRLAIGSFNFNIKIKFHSKAKHYNALTIFMSFLLLIYHSLTSLHEYSMCFLITKMPLDTDTTVLLSQLIIHFVFPKCKFDPIFSSLVSLVVLIFIIFISWSTLIIYKCSTHTFYMFATSLKK